MGNMLEKAGFKIDKTVKTEPNNPYDPFMTLSSKANISFGNNAKITSISKVRSLDFVA